MVPHQARVSARDDEIDELCEQARVAAEKAVVDAGAREAFDRIEVVPGAAVKALSAASTYYDVDGLIIGRHGPRDGGTIVRLGTVARQLLRQLPAAVMVVPPDSDPAERTLGPVMVATDLAPDAAAAARFGLRMAQQLGVDLLLLHVPETGQLAAQLGAQPRSPTTDDPAAFEDWVEMYGLGGARTEVHAGDPVERTLEQARLHDASMIVCGSRRLSLTDRLFQASTGSTLAAYAPCPVVVVPPESMVRVPG